jgi:signal transduction histidine kinase
MQRKIIFLVIVSVLIILISVGIISNFIVRRSIEHSLENRLVLASIIGQNIDYILESNLTRLHDISLSGKVDMSNPYISKTLSEKRPVISDVYEISMTKKKVIYVLVPLKDKDGDMIGVAGGEINPANYMFTNILKSTPAEKDTIIELIDSHGTVISSTEQSRILTNSDHDEFLGNLIARRESRVGACHRCHLEEFSGERKAKDMMAFAPLTLAPWGVSVRELQRTVFAPSATLRKVFLTLSLIYIATAALLAIGLSRSIVRPVRTIIGATKKIARGNLSEPVEVRGRDEFGVLAESVNTMRLKLAEYLDALQGYNVELEGRVRERTGELRHRKRQLATLLDEVIGAQEDERKRIARELHDETSQSLAALGMNLDIAAIALKEKNLTPPMIVELKMRVEQLVMGINRLIHDLRPPVLDDLGFESAVRWLLERHMATKDIKHYLIACDRFKNSSEPIMDKKTELRLFRIIQEAVINIAKHSYADVVSVTLSCTETSLEVDIMDDGVGFSPEKYLETTSADASRGFGILGIRERISQLEGELNIYSKLGEGTHLSIDIPLNVMARNVKD